MTEKQTAARRRRWNVVAGAFLAQLRRLHEDVLQTIRSHDELSTLGTPSFL